MLNFIAAMRVLSFNSETRVKRKLWKATEISLDPIRGLLSHDTHWIFTDRYYPSMNDILADDWEIVR